MGCHGQRLVEGVGGMTGRGGKGGEDAGFGRFFPVGVFEFGISRRFGRKGVDCGD